LEFLPTAESTDGPATVESGPLGDIILDQSNSISRLIVPSANEVVFNNDRQFVTETINAAFDVALSTEAGDVVVQTIDTTANVTLIAADDIRDTDAQDGNRVAGSTLNLVAGNNNNEDPAFNGILLQTDVDTINATVNSTDSGDVILRELTDVNLETIVAGDGFIDVVAIGSIFTGNVSHTTQNANNTITLIAVGDDSDIGVGILSTGGAGNIRLIAGDDVNHSVPPTTTDPVGPVNPVDPVSPVDPVNPVDPAGQPVVAPANQLGNISADEGLVFNTTGSSVDPVITLFNGEGAVVFSSGNAIGNPVVLPSLPVGTYFVAVSGVVTTVDDDFVVVGGDSGGAFVLNVNDFSASGTLVANQVVFYSFTVGAGATNPVAADLDSTGLVTANDLFILADNLTADADSGIHLNTNIVSGDFQVDRGPNPSPNPGSITINEANTHQHR